MLRLLKACIEGQEARVVDLGCGAGDLSRLVSSIDAGIRWTGVDIRDEALRVARERYPEEDWIQASADDLPHPDAAFDIAICSVLFSSVASVDMQRGIADEITRVVRPGGWLIWYDLRYNNPWNPAVHGIGRRDLMGLFNGWRPVDLISTSVLPPIARRLGRTTPILYPALAAIPPLRSHLMGRLQRPSALTMSPRTGSSAGIGQPRDDE